MTTDQSENASSNDGTKQISLVGDPTVLVVDDEELMREITRLIVEENGGKVLEAEDGRSGVDVFKTNSDRIDCVFLDFSMPNMNGYEALIEMKKIRPDIAIVMASGLKAIKEVKELSASGEIEFLSKPFHEAELIRAINRARESAA